MADLAKRLSALDPGDTARRVLLIVALTGILRLALAGVIGLSVDESYTVAISRQLELSYFDHPPLHVWLVGMWRRLVGDEQALLLRLPDIVMFAASTWLMYELTASVYGYRAGLWAALTFNLAPVFTLNTAIGILPDGSLVLFCLLAVWCFSRAVLAPETQRNGLWWMLSTGTAAGLALLSKYTAVFTALSLGMYLLGCRRRFLATPGPWLAAILLVVLFTPALLWNYTHEWASFVFQGSRALPSDFSLQRAMLDLAGQLLYLLPWIAVGLLFALARAVRRGPPDEAGWLFACLAVPPIVVFSLAGLWTKVLPHWPVVGWLFTFPLLGQLLAGFEQTRSRVAREIATATAGFLICVVLVTASQAATGWMERLVPALANNDPTLDFLDWHDLRSTVAQLDLRRKGMIVATVSWIDAGKADYALGGTIPVICVSADARQFAYLHHPYSLSGRNALIVAAAGRPDWLRLVGSHFERIELLPDIQLTRAGEPALTLRAAYGYDFQIGDQLMRRRLETGDAYGIDSSGNAE
jgi:4-amino-4-deoxy-L-arabinose transferase-like glycosyltransferase